MSPDPYTLDGARRILDGRTKTIERLDKLLGVAIISSGVAGLGVPALLAVFGWVDQKNELIARLHDLSARGHQRLLDGERRQRHEVLVATHTALVHGSFFAALEDALGPVYRSLSVTREEKARLSGTGLAGLVTDSIPMPGADGGLERTATVRLPKIYKAMAVRCLRFFSGLESWPRHEDTRSTDPLVREIVGRAVDRYRAEYVTMASDIREFEIWAMLGEHAAAGTSLARLEDLVSTIVQRSTERIDGVRDTLAAINRDVFAAPLIPVDETGNLHGLCLPPVQDGYISPSFRWAIAGPEARPGNEAWWEERTVERDLDTFLAAHFASWDAVDKPLVLLGHPGSGKSLFTKVCAARLSGADRFTPVRVALRDVSDPGAPIYQQIDTPLRHATNGRVSWSELCKTAGDTVRVLFIDGLDELMQASGLTQSSYLANVVEFQRRERLAGSPVAVVVTARTIVADLARIPHGALVLKLEDFDDYQVSEWLKVWRDYNPSSGHALDVEDVIALGDLSHQPLLLLLLAIYGSINELPKKDRATSLYGAVLHDFLIRELSKPGQPTDRPSQWLQREALRKLAVVAFGMFNRGRLYLGEEQLRLDLNALSTRNAELTPTRQGAITEARKVIGGFFFVTASEADRGAAGRSYEFLHATFGEYLIAHQLVEELVSLYQALDRPSSQQWDDDLLFALLSHRLVAASGSTIPDFVNDLVLARSQAEQDGVLDVLRRIAVVAPDRWDRGAFASYDPSGARYLDRLAAYTANLILLLSRVEGSPVPMSVVTPAGLEPETWWRTLLDLWHGAFQRNDAAEWNFLLTVLDRDRDQQGQARIARAAASGRTPVSLPACRTVFGV